MFLIPKYKTEFTKNPPKVDPAAQIIGEMVCERIAAAV